LKIQFTVESPILGYRQTTKKTMFHPKERARSMAYGEFKKRVLIMSIQAGLPNMGLAKKEKAPRLSVAIYWERNPKIDWKNVYGAIEDALWYEDDRYVKPGKFSDAIWDSGVEKAVVTVEL
jgi:hypothetical protein